MRYSPDMPGFRIVCVLLVFVFQCTTDEAPPDGGNLDSSTGCTSDSDCDDGRFCNGEETCSPDASAANTMGCLPGEPPCDEMCDEDTDRCVASGCVTPDADGDGANSIECGGNDCDDEDANRYPGNTEVCDPEDHDEDCDPNTFGVRDADMDGFPDATCCNEGETGPVCGTDCDDTLAIVHPTEAESCDTLDNDCDGMADEGVSITFTEDADRDGHGSSAPGAATMIGCVAPMGFSETADDCDDSNSGVNPGLPEQCDSNDVDENCDGITNPAELCTCTGDQSRDCIEEVGACRAGRQVCVDGEWSACSIAPTPETCNGVDDDCDNEVDDGVTVTCYEDADNDTYPRAGAPPQELCPSPARIEFGQCPIGTTSRAPADGTDCNETDPSVNPGRTEICNMVDDNCNSSTDEGVSITCYTDNDGDTWARSDTELQRCPDASRGIVGGCPVGTTNRLSGTLDCDDTESSISPGAAEICETPPSGMSPVDENCNGQANEDCNCTGSETRACPEPGVCGMGTQTCSGGEWGTCSQLPGVELCNGLDDDCDSVVDNGSGFVCQAGQTQGCTTACSSPGTQTCSASCTTFGTCLGAEVCNACDDDGVAGPDDSFLCVQGAAGQDCQTGCLTNGVGTCNSTCDGAIASTCVAASETCNYCDDDGDGSTFGETGVSLNRRRMGLKSCSDMTMMGTATCAAGPREITFVNGPNQVGGAWVNDGIILGYQTFELRFRITCTNNGVSANPEGAFAVIFATGIDPAIGAAGSMGFQAGVPVGAGTGLVVTFVPADSEFNGMSAGPAVRFDDLDTATGGDIGDDGSIEICEGGSTVTDYYFYYLPPTDASDAPTLLFSRTRFVSDPAWTIELPSYLNLDPGNRVQIGFTAATGADNLNFKLETIVHGSVDELLYTAGKCNIEENEGSVRIVGDRTVSGGRRGRLEVFHNDMWGTVCSDNFDDLDADVACRQMGYRTGVVSGMLAGVGNVWMDDVACDGTEDVLADCTFAGWGVENCSHSQDVRITCQL